MKNIQTLTDKSAIGLSLLCAVHCLAFPLILVLLPSVAALQLDNEAFHLWMVVAVLPTSTYALTVGCKQHKHYYLLAFGLVGLACLVLAVALGESVLTEAGEKSLTVIGAAIITYGHFRNYRLCSHKENCQCPQ
ncbi:MerC domain-containing protein [Aliikangiella coralliicola]|uniref:MerC domain-containing protein n=1 Tax=Aliikangiella coralliicola TaxID=2592383 RepID=A0A545UGG1_9GAMM|nr:MerC domain-containing protein [Aliikangiella coralliicola]TQV88572.1 MerC domain-containing protein [Aliikangiella coralliicola]